VDNVRDGRNQLFRVAGEWRRSRKDQSVVWGKASELGEPAIARETLCTAGG